MATASSQQWIILLLLLFINSLRNTSAATCDPVKFSSVLQNTTLTISFTNNDLLKLDRRIACSSDSSWTIVEGCTHVCSNLTYGEYYSAQVQLSDGSDRELCSIEGQIDLQPPTLALLQVFYDKVSILVNYPLGSFDYFFVRCPDGTSFNSTKSELMFVLCSIIPGVPLMDVVLETVKDGFQPAVNHIVQEIPLPIPFNYTHQDLVLTITADPPPEISLPSTYDFLLGFYAEDIFYERAKIKLSNIRPGELFTYNLIPNLTHHITFQHTVDTIGSSKSEAIFTPVYTEEYPKKVTDLTVHEAYNNILVEWSDPHQLNDPIEFFIICDSKTNISENVGRNRNHVCLQKTLNETNQITVLTQVTIPGYTHDQIGVAAIDVPTSLDLPFFEAFNRSETTIHIRWDSTSIPSTSTRVVYGIQCSLQGPISQFAIESNEYQCASLQPGTLYVITMHVSLTDGTVQRSNSINANTLLPKTEMQSYYYNREPNGQYTVVIEWIPPNAMYEAVHVSCPSANNTFQYYQLMPVMYVKCLVDNVTSFDVKFWTAKSGYEWAMSQFTITLPTNPLLSTASLETSTLSSESITSVGTASSTTSTGSMSSTSSTGTVSSTTSTGTASPITSAGTVSSVTTTVPSSGSTTAGGSTTSGGVFTTSGSSATRSSSVSSTTSSTGNSADCDSYTRDLLDMKQERNRWRIIAIISLITAAFLFLVATVLIIFMIFR